MLREFDDPIFSEVRRYNVNVATPTSDLEEMPDDVEYLVCDSALLHDLGPLQRFTRLRVLDICATLIASLDGIERFARLEVLFADFGRFATLDPLAGVPTLRSLDVTCSRVDLTDLTPLGGLTRLERLYVAHSPIQSIRPIMHLESLRLLSVAGTMIPSSEIAQFEALHPACEVWR